METIQNRFEMVLESIYKSCKISGRSPEEVNLVVVTKRQPIDRVIQVIEAGATQLGENYPEEITLRKESIPGFETIEWHMIGHVQSRKVKYLSAFSTVHSIDSFELLFQLERKIERKIPVLLEVNISGENSKNGFNLADSKNYEPFRQQLERLRELHNCEIVGLMCMPPLVQDGEQNRVYFRRCRELREYLMKKPDLGNVREISMGTSGDYKVAIEEGATFVRIGELIMGTRPGF